MLVYAGIGNPRIILATIIIILSCFTLIASFLVKKRDEALKTTGIFFVIGISLFSHYWVTYFITIFIISTLIADSEFLQNLAAIVGKNEKYFEMQSRRTDEKKDAVEKEFEDYEVTPETTQSPESRKKIFIESYFLIENFVLSYLEKQLSNRIERELFLHGKHGSVELDGLIVQEGRDIIFEVKYATSDEAAIKSKEKYIKQAKEILKRYTEITNKQASLRLVIVGDLNFQTKKVFYQTLLNTHEPDSKLDVVLSFISLKEVGLKLEDGKVVPFQ